MELRKKITLFMTLVLILFPATHQFGFGIYFKGKNNHVVAQDNSTELTFSAFIGGPNFEIVNDIVLDQDNNIYITGSTDSADFPTTEGSYDQQGTGGESVDIFVLKISPDGNQIIFSTYISGNDYETPTSIVLDNSNNIIVTGITESNDFPTTDDAYNKTGDPNSSDIFIFKLSNDGSKLLFSSYLSGNDLDQVNSLAVDGSNNMYLTGYTLSTDFPGTSTFMNRGVNQTYSDIFISKISADGSNLLFSTIIRGNGIDEARSILIDNSSSIYVAGTTKSTDFPTTSGSYDESGDSNPATKDGFICKLSPNGDTIDFSTYVEGSSSDVIDMILIDTDKNIYIVGFTSSTDFPTTANAFDIRGDADASTSDIFASKLSSDGSNLLYSTYIGGQKSESVTDAVLDDRNNLYFTGSTTSTTFPTTSNAFNRNGDGNEILSDSFVSKLSADGSALVYSSYIGGNQNDFGSSLTLDKEENIYITGYTNSLDFPVTSESLSGTGGTLSGSSDGFVLKMHISSRNNTKGFPIPILDLFEVMLAMLATGLIRFKSTEKKYN